MNRLTFLLCCLLCSVFVFNRVQAQTQSDKPFVHPGMSQNRKDLNYMKKMVRSGTEPWKGAFERLRRQTALAFKPMPQTHISVGAYGANSKGGKEFFQSSQMAYNHALMWYLTDDKRYAQKAMEILKAWSKVLWDFDANNAKLNVGLAGPGFLQAAEILKYSNAGWETKEQERFEEMVLTVFYPVIKDFFTEANGNWDASMICTMLCIGVLVDNHEIFNRAVERFFRGPGNSGITKYIYPNGQIQETTRDWGHVQLGIGEFAKAAQVAWTQGVDFYSAADNRLALGFEYTARFLLGDERIPVYGVLSNRARDKYRDIYESVYDHYHTLKGVEMPFTARVIEEHTRKRSSLMLLTGLRAPLAQGNSQTQVLHFSKGIKPVTTLVGATAIPKQAAASNVVYLSPDDSIQAALDVNAGTGKQLVLREGVYTLYAPLRIPSGTMLTGEGKKTILFLAADGRGKTLVNAEADMHNVLISDLLIEGATRVITNEDPNSERRTRSYMNAPSREGISFQADSLGQMKNIRLLRVTVQNFTKNGVTIRGADDVIVHDCNFSDNGSSVVPGAGFHHNLHLTRIRNVEITDSRFDTSPWGSGIDLTFAARVLISGNEMARNKLSGIHCAESSHVSIKGNLAEGNDEHGIYLEKMWQGNQNLEVVDNLLQYNSDDGFFDEDTLKLVHKNNRVIGNGKQ